MSPGTTLRFKRKGGRNERRGAQREIPSMLSLSKHTPAHNTICVRTQSFITVQAQEHDFSLCPFESCKGIKQTKKNKQNYLVKYHFWSFFDENRLCTLVFSQETVMSFVLNGGGKKKVRKLFERPLHFSYIFKQLCSCVQSCRLTT